MDASDSCNLATFSLVGAGTRSWNIKATQYKCGDNRGGTNTLSYSARLITDVPTERVMFYFFHCRLQRLSPVLHWSLRNRGKVNKNFFVYVHRYRDAVDSNGVFTVFQFQLPNPGRCSSFDRYVFCLLL